MGMISQLTILAVILAVNSFFSVIPWLLPRMSVTTLLPYQLWTNVLMLFYILLPKRNVSDYILQSQAQSGGGRRRNRRTKK